MPVFRKAERITSLKEVEHLFERGSSSSVQAMPLRAVYQFVRSEDAAVPPVKVLVSVAKKRLRHAVDRNRAKRQVREAWRLGKEPLFEALAAQGRQMRIAFVWLAVEPVPTAAVSRAMSRIVSTITQRLARPHAAPDAKQDNP